MGYFVGWPCLQFFNDTDGGHDAAGGVQNRRYNPPVQHTVDIVADQFGFHVKYDPHIAGLQPVDTQPENFVEGQFILVYIGQDF